MAYEGIPLGKETAYQFSYDASLLFAIARGESRADLALDEDALPFSGIDRWTAYELSWLNEKGMPQVAIAEFDFAADSPNLVESKSFKLYLNSFNQSRFSQKDLLNTLTADLSACSGKAVKVSLFALGDEKLNRQNTGSDYRLLDELDVVCSEYDCNADILSLVDGKDVEPTEQNKQGEQLYCSHLFRSLCPVTSQPDWASVYIRVVGKPLQAESLLKYLVAYRNHQGFHEQCVEQICLELKALNAFSEIEVYARFLRRGGLDINPYRCIGNAVAAGKLSVPSCIDVRQ
jgi:7-cyano-7-deazaguanine reductase